MTDAIDVSDPAAAHAAVVDPATSAQTLSDIAYRYPALRVTVAAHPTAYAGLLDWLDNLGDPVVSAAVASRRTAEAAAPPPPPPSSLAASPPRFGQAAPIDHVATAPAQPRPPVDLLAHATKAVTAIESGGSGRSVARPTAPRPAVPPGKGIDDMAYLRAISKMDEADGRSAQATIAPSTLRLPAGKPGSQSPAGRSGSQSSVGRSAGLIPLLGGVGLFIVCQLIQVACGSSMFSGTYYHNGIFQDLLINLTFWPGWIVSAGLVLLGVVALIGGEK